MSYNTYSQKCYAVLKTHLDPYTELELPQCILCKIAGFSLGNHEGLPPLCFRYMEVLATVLAVGGRLHWQHTHSDTFLDERFPATPMGLSAQWSYLTAELLQAMVSRATPSVVNVRYSTLINSIALAYSTYANDHAVTEFLQGIRERG